MKTQQSRRLFCLSPLYCRVIILKIFKNIRIKRQQRYNVLIGYDRDAQFIIQDISMMMRNFGILFDFNYRCQNVDLQYLQSVVRLQKCSYVINGLIIQGKRSKITISLLYDLSYFGLKLQSSLHLIKNTNKSHKYLNKINITHLSDDLFQYNNTEMEKIIISAEFVNIYCFIGNKELLFQTFEQIRSNNTTLKESSNIKMVFLIYNMTLKEYTTFYEHLKQTYSSQFKEYFINILIVKNRTEAEEHLNHIRKVNQSEFQYNYLKLQEHSERSLRLEVVENYILAKFKWNKVKTKYFLEKNNISSMKDLLEYSRFPYFEKTIIDKTKQFREYCERAINSKENLQ